MSFEIILPGNHLKGIVRNIEVFESASKTGKTQLPFFADGCPGIMYAQTLQGVFLQGQRLPDLLLYGQTVQPIQLSVTGHYRLIVFYLYPYVVKNLFGMDADTLTDGCFNLSSLPQAAQLTSLLVSENFLDQQIHLLTEFLITQATRNVSHTNSEIESAIRAIVKAKGILNIKALKSNSGMADRTFERRFLKHVGITPKLFARIIQFQSSLAQLNDQHFFRLTDIGFDSGFADQSHFIRSFKEFTGKKPLAFSKALK